MGFKPFEKSKADKEPKGMKEGTKREEKFDAKQMKGISPKGKGVAPFAKGGVVKKGSRGC